MKTKISGMLKSYSDMLNEVNKYNNLYATTYLQHFRPCVILRGGFKTITLILTPQCKRTLSQFKQF